MYIMEYISLDSEKENLGKKYSIIIPKQKSKAISIPRTPSFEYSLSNSLIDPNNSSPPSEFQIKLSQRIKSFSLSKDS